MEALLSLIPAALTIWLGIRLGPRRSSIAIRIALAATLASTLVARYLYAQPDAGWQVGAWGTLIGGIFLMCTLALIGPTLFARWLYALAASIAAITLARFVLSGDMLVCFFTGACAPP